MANIRTFKTICPDYADIVFPKSSIKNYLTTNLESKNDENPNPFLDEDEKEGEGKLRSSISFGLSDDNADHKEINLKNGDKSKLFAIPTITKATLKTVISLDRSLEVSKGKKLI